MNNTAYLSENQVLNKRSYPSLIWKASIFSREMAVNRAFHDISEDDIVEAVYGLSPTERELLSCFMEYHNLCPLVYVSQGRVGRRVGRCRKTVSRALGVFERLGLMARTKRGIKKTCVYRVPEKVLKSFGLRERLKGLIPAFRFYSLVILASIYGVSDNNVPQVKHTVGSFYTNKFNMYKKSPKKENKVSYDVENPPPRIKKRWIDGKMVRVECLQMGRYEWELVWVGGVYIPMERYIERLEKSAKERAIAAERRTRGELDKINASIGHKKNETVDEKWRALQNAEKNAQTCENLFYRDIHLQTVARLQKEIEQLLQELK